MKTNKQFGFTLLELMIVVLMLGIVTAVGIPSFRSMMVSSEIAETTNDFMVSLKRARNEAMKRGKDVRMCSSTDGETCSGVAGNWSKGWLLFVDTNTNGQVDESAGELIWVKEMDSSSQVTITPTNSEFDSFIDYSFSGVLAGGIAAGFNICSGYAATDGYPRREISISISGGPVFLKNTAVSC